MVNNKQDLMKIQTCVLRVNIHCDGCKQKVKKLLQKMEGVYTTSIDSEQGKVTVTGHVDPAMLIRKLEKSGKHAELWGGVQKGKGGGGGGGGQNNNNYQNLLNNQFKNLQMDNFKGGKVNKSQKGGGGGNPQQQAMLMMQQMQQMRGAKQMVPQKDQKSVKFSVPEDDEFDESDEDFDDYDDDFDSEFDDEDDEFGHNRMPPNSKNMMSKGLGGPMPGMMRGGGGGGGVDLAMMMMKSNMGGKKGGEEGAGKNSGLHDNNKMKNGVHDIHVKAKHSKGGGGNNVGNHSMDHMGQIPNHPMGQMGRYPNPMGQGHSMQAIQATLPGAMSGGYYQGMGQGINPYSQQQQQQYMTMMMNQQRAYGNDMIHPMMYAPPPATVSYGPPMPPLVSVDPYTHYFSDENVNSCSVM